MNMAKNILQYTFGKGAVSSLRDMLAEHRDAASGCVYFVDSFFENSATVGALPLHERDLLIHVPTDDEPTTGFIDEMVERVQTGMERIPYAVIGMGGGITLDTAKAVANLLTNGGKAEEYQGWDLVRIPGVFKIGIPTLSGTGAETSRTCVMTNTRTGLKLGMNSNHTIYDQLVLDPDLTRTVPRNQYFYTGLDTFIHCLESLAGRHRHPMSDAYSREAISLSREIFLSDDMMDDANREKLMVASYLGGCAIANSYVGVVHPFSAGLSVVLGTHHCIGNCITMTAMAEFYPREVEEFLRMAEKQGVDIPKGVCRDLTDDQFERLYQATIIHEKPLANALGDGFRSILTKDKIVEIFSRM
jgi:3-deoxy-alpha-D-manno-octulosonate 8-oxidase